MYISNGLRLYFKFTLVRMVRHGATPKRPTIKSPLLIYFAVACNAFFNPLFSSFKNIRSLFTINNKNYFFTHLPAFALWAFAFLTVAVPEEKINPIFTALFARNPNARSLGGLVSKS